MAAIGIANVALSTSSTVAILYRAIVGKPAQYRRSKLPALIATTLPIERLVGVMMLLITVVSLVIHAYSRRYMQWDDA